MTESINQFIHDLNRAWQKGDFTAVANAYHEEVVLLPPDSGPPICGRAAVVKSYQDFHEQATLNDFRITELDVYPFGATSGEAMVVHMVHMRFEVEYQLDGINYWESGLEVYTVMNNPAPQIIWRSQTVLDNRILD